MDWEESKRLKEFERRLQQRLGRSGRGHLPQDHRRRWLRIFIYTIWYVLVAVATVSTIYHWGF